MAPDTQGLKAWCSQLGAAVVHPGQATCMAGGRSTLDFFLLSHVLSQCVDSIKVLHDAPISPRSPVELWMKGVSLSIPIRIRVQRQKFPTKKPVG
eukprot:2834292-Pyramimonas_sp.AAC.1